MGVLVSAAAPVAADDSGSVWVEAAKLAASDAGDDDEFGWGASISGNTIVVGAPFADTVAGEDSGAAYVFTDGSGGWAENAKLTPSDAAAGQWFGTATAVAGNLAVVGAPYAGDGSGAAYVFTRTRSGWVESAKLEASGATGFGGSLAIFGRTIAISERSGPVHVFTRTRSGWFETAELEPSDGESWLSATVAIYGNTIVVGAPKSVSDGAVYVFAGKRTHWTESQKLVPPHEDVPQDFGSSVAVSEDTLVVGEPRFLSVAGARAYVYERADGVWTDTATLMPSSAEWFDSFGFSVDIAGDTIVVGAPSQDLAPGAAFVFARSGGGWVESVKLIPSTSLFDDQFGWSVAASGDTVVVGAIWNHDAGPFSGTAFVFGE